MQQVEYESVPYNDNGSRSCKDEALKRGSCAQREAACEGMRADWGLRKKQEPNR